MASVITALQTTTGEIDFTKFGVAYVEERKWQVTAGIQTKYNPLAESLFVQHHDANDSIADQIGAPSATKVSLLLLYAVALEALRRAVIAPTKEVDKIVAAYKHVEIVTQEMTRREWLLARMMAKAQQAALNGVPSFNGFATSVVGVVPDRAGYDKTENGDLWFGAYRLGTAMKTDPPSVYVFPVASPAAIRAPISGDDSDDWW